jgi:hypothetical protein
MRRTLHPLMGLLCFLSACFGGLGGQSDTDEDGDNWSLEGSPADCDDGDASVFPGATEVPDDGIDQDCDGEDAHEAPDNDGDGVDADTDCDDDDPLITPGRPEYCNAKDDNCDGVADEGWDDDADGVTPCGPDGQSGTVDDDCDDDDPAVSPNLLELCGGGDENCSGEVDEGFDQDGDGVSTCGPDGIDGTADDDCDDNDADVRPGIWDDCDGRDVNCNGQIDEDGPAGCGDDDLDGDGFSPPEDCDESSAAVNPAASEVCNGRDDDCDGGVDEGFDADGDGWLTCTGDCDDGDADIHPQASDAPGNGIDEDCSGADQVSDCVGSWFTIGEFEPNNSVTSPNLVTTPNGHVTVTGVLSCGGDEDHLVLAFACGGPVTVSLDADGGATLSVSQENVLLGSDFGASPLAVSTTTEPGQVQIAVGCQPAGGGVWSLLIDWD